MLHFQKVLKMLRINLFFYLLFLIISFSPTAKASPATTNVEISDRAYRDIEKLVAFKMCYPPMIDQRPFARGEFARIIAEARTNFSKIKTEDNSQLSYKDLSTKLTKIRTLDQIITRLTSEFQEELIDTSAIAGEKASIRIHPIEQARVDAILLDSTPTQIPVYTDVGYVDAQVNPLLHYREGRHAVDGFQGAIETKHRLKLSNHLAILIHPRVETNAYVNGQNNYSTVLLQEGYGVLQAGDAALEFGRSSVVWGPSERGSLLITNNARPLDLIKFSTPSPFELPWVFRHLGKFRISLFGANLGPEQTFKYAWLTGYRLSYMPWRYLELGFGNTTTMGGEGSSSLSASEIVGEFFGFRPAGTAPNSPNKTNHLMEASILLRIPSAWGLQIYGVLNNDDKRDTLKRFFRDGSAFLAGFYLPRIGTCGISSFRFEFIRTSAIHYRHGFFQSGYTLDNLFIGDDIGPDGLGIHTRFDYDLSDNTTISAIGDWDMRRSDLHGVTLDPDGTLGDTIVTESRPAEKRYRFVVEPNFKIRNNLNLVINAGYERVTNAQYVQGADKNHWLLAVSLRLNFDKNFKFGVKP